LGAGLVHAEGRLNFFVDQYPLIVVIFLALGLMTTVSNYFLVRRFGDYPDLKEFPCVSVLVPARDEACSIEACVRSLLAQDYPNFEVLVLDDHSTDETRALLMWMICSNSRLRVLDGRPLPSGWLGKHWACHQLSQSATGELLLFTDADTYHQPDMLRVSVASLLAERADLVTAFPEEQVKTWGEKLIVPVIGFGIFAFLPVALSRRLRWPSLSVTIGQFMLFRRSAFEGIGGYRSVRQQLVDDVALGRRILACGYQWRLLDGTEHVRCRMYHGFWEAVDGFSKNVFAFFEYRVFVFVLAWLWVVTALLEPPLALASRALGMPLTRFPPDLAAVAVAQSLLIWRIAYKRFRLPGYLALLYPFSLLLFVLIALRSMLWTLTGQATWKGRNLTRPALRW
jgi:chlorobactene glucosyltransferase